MSIPNYQRFKPPISVPFRELKPSEAKRYFAWFLVNIPVRLAILEESLSADSVDVPLDFSVESLQPLEDWFRGKVSLRTLNQTEIDLLHEQIPFWMWNDVGITDLDEDTYSLCFDVGIYFGETVKQMVSGAFWDYVKKPKRDADIHQPVIVTSTSKGHLNPVRVIDVVFRKIIHGTHVSGGLAQLAHLRSSALSASDLPPC